MSQRKRRQRRKAATRSEPATGTNGAPTAKVSRRKRRAWPVLRVRLTWRDATQSARWLNRTAVVWCLSVVALVAVFFWQRMFPVAGVWVSTADLQAVEPVVGGGALMPRG